MATTFSSARQSVLNISLLWLGSLASAATVFLSQIVLARQLSPGGYGDLAAAIAAVNLLSPLAGFGIQGFWLNVFGSEGWGAVRWIYPSIRFLVLSSLLALVLLYGWAVLGSHNGSSRQLVCLLLPLVAAYPLTEVVTCKLQIEERYSSLALWQLAPNLARLILLVIMAIATSSNLEAAKVAEAYSFVAVGIFITGSFQVMAMARGRLALKGHAEEQSPQASIVPKINYRLSSIDVVRQAWPYGMSGIFYIVYYQSDIILLELLAGDKAAGAYNVAFVIMMGVYLLPNAIYQRFLLPKFHRWEKSNVELSLRIYRAGNGVMLALGVLTTCTLLMLIPWLIPVCFGVHYQDAIGPLTILAFCAPVRFLASGVEVHLFNQKNVRRMCFYMGIVAVTNLVINLLLIPHYGTKGAAAATLLTEITLLGLSLIGVRKYVFGSNSWKAGSL